MKAALWTTTQEIFSYHEYASREDCIHEDKELREHLSEKQIDKMIEDSFPASDPPSTY